MVQNHILQVVALLAMEPPVAFSEKEIRTEKIKALKAIRIYNEEEVLENFHCDRSSPRDLLRQGFHQK